MQHHLMPPPLWWEYNNAGTSSNICSTITRDVASVSAPQGLLMPCLGHFDWNVRCLSLVIQRLSLGLGLGLERPVHIPWFAGCHLPQRDEVQWQTLWHTCSKRGQNGTTPVSLEGFLMPTAPSPKLWLLASLNAHRVNRYLLSVSIVDLCLVHKWSAKPLECCLC